MMPCCRRKEFDLKHLMNNVDKNEGYIRVERWTGSVEFEFKIAHPIKLRGGKTLAHHQLFHASILTSIVL
jgi:hypothetical protein